MMGLTKKFLPVLLWAAFLPASFGFTPLGPFKNWQAPILGYNRPGDIGGPMSPLETYRWNVPVIYYAFDHRFVAYFGRHGVAAVDSAMKTFNDLPRFSQITNDGSSLFINGQPVPTDGKGPPNFSLNVAGLLDLKSHAMQLVIEELGLAQPERWVWSLRDRDVFTAGGEMFTNYSVIKGNFDPITLQHSSYVNGTLYGYSVEEPLGPVGNQYADALETISGLPAPYAYTSVASGFAGPGEYYFGLTHDDVGGLRMIYNVNNIVAEQLLTGITGGTSQGIRGAPWRPYQGITNAALLTNGVVLPGTGGTNIITQGLRPGLNKIKFQRVNYDSLLGTLFNPITNTYTDTVIAGGRPVSQSLQRPVTQPDIVFTVTDLGTVFEVPVLTRRTSTLGWQDNSAINGLPVNIPGGGPGGPGVITPLVAILFSDKLPYYLNGSPDFLDGDDGSANSGTWGSFDENTETPIIYPIFLDLTLDDLNSRALGRGP